MGEGLSGEHQPPVPGCQRAATYSDPYLAVGALWCQCDRCGHVTPADGVIQ
jgi:hypothetical protein